MEGRKKNKEKPREVQNNAKNKIPRAHGSSLILFPQKRARGNRRERLKRKKSQRRRERGGGKEITEIGRKTQKQVKAKVQKKNRM